MGQSITRRTVILQWHKRAASNVVTSHLTLRCPTPGTSFVYVTWGDNRVVRSGVAAVLLEHTLGWETGVTSLLRATVPVT